MAELGKLLTVIPARMGSSRFPGKPLKQILGMPMLGHCWHRARLAVGTENLFVATCDREIAEYIESIGGAAVMTSPSHERAAERTAEALVRIEEASGQIFTHVMMIQGDEPIVTPEVISLAVDYSGDEVDVVNVMSRIVSREAFEDHNNVKVVTDNYGRALYFSREPIPSPWRGFKVHYAHMQTGIMMFSRDSLLEFDRLEVSDLEVVESVDLNRFLAHGKTCQMVRMESPTIGVDTPEELRSAEIILQSDPVTRQYISL